MAVARAVVLSAALAVASSGPVFAQSYNPVGPQTNVPIATVTGGDWTECYSAPYEQFTGEDLPAIQAACNGGRLMLACGPAGGDTLTLLAQTLRERVFQNPGSGRTHSHLSNGAQWYFNVGGGGIGRNSWGFAAAGDSLDRTNCDVATGSNPEARLCWHLNEAGGYRCGETENLNDSTEWTKYIYTTAPGVPTVPPWQLAALAVLLAVAAAVLLRRRTSMPSAM